MISIGNFGSEQGADDNAECGETQGSEGERHDEASQSDSDPKWFDVRAAMLVSEIHFSQAVLGPDTADRRDVIYSEIKCLIANDTWKLVVRPSTGKVIGSRTVL